MPNKRTQSYIIARRFTRGENCLLKSKSFFVCLRRRVAPAHFDRMYDQSERAKVILFKQKNRTVLFWWYLYSSLLLCIVQLSEWAERQAAILIFSLSHKHALYDCISNDMIDWNIWNKNKQLCLFQILIIYNSKYDVQIK